MAYLETITRYTQMAIRLPLVRQPSPWLELKNHAREKTHMKDQLMKLSVKMQALLMNEEGQDLIEYALVVALIGLAATAGMTSLATSINLAFSNLGSTLQTYTT
jgi:pilus assembly protein Flp/PilA